MTEADSACSAPMPDAPGQHALEEFKRQRRLVDQMTTAHSRLRDRYHRRATAGTCSLLAASAIAIAFAFASGGDEVTIVGITAQRATWLGWFAVAIFIFTLVDLILDWRGNARRYGEAARQLALLKAEYRAPPAASAEMSEFDRLTQRYQAVMDALPAIPEHQFLPLKARHLRKVELSRILSARPGMTVRQARQELRKRSS